VNNFWKSYDSGTKKPNPTEKLTEAQNENLLNALIFFLLLDEINLLQLARDRPSGSVGNTD
jgi:hypothetical protein